MPSAVSLNMGNGLAISISNPNAKTILMFDTMSSHFVRFTWTSDAFANTLGNNFNSQQYLLVSDNVTESSLHDNELAWIQAEEGRD